MEILILGAGGHGKVICDAISAANAHRIIGFLDDNPDLWGTKIFGCHPVLGPIDSWRQRGADALAIGIGSNHIRSSLFERCRAEGAKIASVIHPSVTLSRHAELGEGVVILARVCVGPEAIIGENTILNTACSVDHNCVLGAHTHMSVGVNIAGEASFGEGVFAGAGATVIQGVKVGDWAILGAGAVVINNVNAGTTVVGVPAQTITRKPTDA